jgi:hypothetical protein
MASPDQPQLQPPSSPSATQNPHLRAPSNESRTLAFADGVIPDQLPPRPSNGQSSYNGNSWNKRSADFGVAVDDQQLEMSKEPPKKCTRKQTIKITFILLFVCAAFSLQFIPAVTKQLVVALYWFYDNQAAGIVILWVIYCFGTVFMIPGKTLLAM